MNALASTQYASAEAFSNLSTPLRNDSLELPATSSQQQTYTGGTPRQGNEPPTWVWDKDNAKWVDLERYTGTEPVSADQTVAGTWSSPHGTTRENAIAAGAVLSNSAPNAVGIMISYPPLDPPVSASMLATAQTGYGVSWDLNNPPSSAPAEAGLPYVLRAPNTMAIWVWDRVAATWKANDANMLLEPEPGFWERGPSTEFNQALQTRVLGTGADPFANIAPATTLTIHSETERQLYGRSNWILRSSDGHAFRFAEDPHWGHMQGHEENAKAELLRSWEEVVQSTIWTKSRLSKPEMKAERELFRESRREFLKSQWAALDYLESIGIPSDVQGSEQGFAAGEYGVQNKDSYWEVSPYFFLTNYRAANGSFYSLDNQTIKFAGDLFKPENENATVLRFSPDGSYTRITMAEYKSWLNEARRK